MKHVIGNGPSRFTCAQCAQYHHHMGPPIKQKGVTMHMGERYCLEAKRARRFRRGDPKVYAPAWCPRLKTPRELRIYGFKSTRDWYFHEEECRQFGAAVLPSAWRYAVEFELHTELSAQEFWKRLGTETAASLLGAVVHRYRVVEIDDGLKPAFFYNTGSGFQVLLCFNAEIARKNKKEDAD